MYRIRRAAELAGVSPELLRAWERRYGLVSPIRTDSGYRVYTDHDVRVLRGAKRLVDGGQSIAEVAQLPPDEILAAAGGPPAPPAASAASLREQEPLREARGSLDPLDLGPQIEEAIAAIGAFDQERLEGTMFRVMSLGVLAPEEICDRFLLPLLAAIGDEWEAGRLSIAAEHFGSALIRSKILRLIEPDRSRGSAPGIVCACPAGEEHEGALLAFAVSASRAGLRVIYLGADTPADDIVRAAERTGAPIVALSVTKPLMPAEIQALVLTLEPWRASSSDRSVVVGGRGALRSRHELEAAGLRVADRIDGGLSALRRGAPQ